MGKNYHVGGLVARPCQVIHLSLEVAGSNPREHKPTFYALKGVPHGIPCLGHVAPFYWSTNLPRNHLTASSTTDMCHHVISPLSCHITSTCQYDHLPRVQYDMPHQQYNHAMSAPLHSQSMSPCHMSVRQYHVSSTDMPRQHCTDCTVNKILHVWQSRTEHDISLIRHPF
jgi:hypothetical protein